MLTECRKCGSNIEGKLKPIFIGDPKRREIDLDKSEVICQECGDPIEDISSFMKNTMKLNGDMVVAAEVKVPEGGMKTDCKHCNKSFSAKVNKKDLKVYCDYCKKEADLSPFAVANLKENGIYDVPPPRKVKPDVDEASSKTPEAPKKKRGRPAKSKVDKATEGSE